MAPTPGLRRSCRLGVAALLSLVLVGHGSADAGVESPVDAGDVVIVESDRQTQPLPSGDSNTVFALRLPDGASCPGDSANDQWRVQSFMIPATDDPGTLRYGVNKPDGDERWSLYTQGGSFVNALTAENDGPGQPGLILALPTMTFANVPAGRHAEGDYRIGIACSYFDETAVYWDTTIIVTADADVEPGGLRWRVAGTPEPRASDQTTRAWPFVLIVGAAGIAGAAAVLLRRRHISPTTQKDAP